MDKSKEIHDPKLTVVEGHQCRAGTGPRSHRGGAPVWGQDEIG
jgi:hypothetical protein